MPSASTSGAIIAQAMMSACNPTCARYRKILKEWAALLVLILLCLFIGANNPRFFQSQNLIRIATSSTLILLFAIGETFVIMMGSIDLSIEGVVALSAVMV